MTHFTFIRHGETDWNRQQRFQGQVDVPLNAAGHAQAALLARRLATEAADVLVSSDLIRARETSAPIAAIWGIEPSFDAGFREQSFGIVDGLDVPTIKARHSDLWALWLEQRADFQIPGGESLRQFHDRVMSAVRGLAQRWPARRIAVVTHGGVLDMLWRSAEGLPLDGLRHCEIPNAGINRMTLDGDALAIECWADADHLAGMPEQPSTVAGER